jgi:hypothetical protein
MHKGTIFHIVAHLSVVGSPLTSKQIDYLSRHNPKQPKLIEENILNGTSNFTMKKMLCEFTKPLSSP